MRYYCLVKDNFFNELLDLHELNTDSALHQNVNLMRDNPPYNTHSSRGQASSAHYVFFTEEIADPVRFVSSVMAPAAHGHMLCAEVLFFH